MAARRDNLELVPAIDLPSLKAELAGLFAGDARVRLALLFGSQARGRAGADSDVDLAVDAADDALPELAARISERLGTEVDVIALRSASIPMLEHLIHHAIVVHEGERGQAAAWRARTLAQLELDRPWYHRMRDAWLARVANEGLRNGR